MSEQQDVIAELGNAGVLAGIRWAYQSATARLLTTSADDAAFDDPGWVGTSRFKLFTDRLDRVFACKRYSVNGGDPDAALDLLYAQLPSNEIESMPRLDPGVVVRNNLNLSNGWSFGDKRFLLAAAGFGKLRELPWSQKSPTKQKVASQPDAYPDQGSLFDGDADTELSTLEAQLKESQKLDMTTFVVGHSIDMVSGDIELGFGRPRLNSAGGDTWLWLENLLKLPPVSGGRRGDTGPGPTGLDVEPDAPVRLRRRPATESGGDAIGAQ
ncbi:hypothetical protein NN3_25010 [Nocardia neocaledoniensis NBRC 108232]|uniref:Uncharacterized protein n=1 Tax=Nocardia neocaledoniensis TaxID=236511 RepID=A0A317NWP1_9NOCA|nr:hypothetical protein [Nocardia neocaledoniensis]PWV79709.1 hypothetical protein DFR69_102775 [Nocardia neocaledoniensis]GEM31494.1 hypothetical protein NN3_25010 [Nocardia neocaledoniensis NBRC 108232]